MPEYLQFIILLGVGTLAGAINVIAGGGSTLTLPTLIFLGLDGAMANGTNRIALVLQNVFASLSFHREEVSSIRQSLMFAAFTLPGAVIGSFVAVQISDIWFQRILGIVMIGVVFSMILPRSSTADELTPKGNGSWWVYPTLFGLGFYGGFIQVGIGFLFMATFYHILKMTLVYVNMHKVTVILIYTIPALSIFALTGNVNWTLGMGLAAGTAFGAWWTAKFAVRKGEKGIRYMLVVAILVMSMKILNLF